MYEPGARAPKLCPAWSLCGRVKNQRELVGASVWLGHLLSADTVVPAHTSAEQLRYFELAARTFDLVVVDECDEAQRVLDGHGALTLTLTGDDQSVHTSLQLTAGLLAANRAPVSDPVLRYIQHANEFERHTLRFLAEMRRLQRQRPATGAALRREAAHRDLPAAGGGPRQPARRGRPHRAGAERAARPLGDARCMRCLLRAGRRGAGTWREGARHAPALGLSP